MKATNLYVAPSIEEVEFAVEQGFAVSDPTHAWGDWNEAGSDLEGGNSYDL